MFKKNANKICLHAQTFLQKIPRKIVLPKQILFLEQKEDRMKSDLVLGIVFGAMAGMVIATFCKPAQQAIKKGTQVVSDETKNLLNKSKSNND